MACRKITENFIEMYTLYHRLSNKHWIPVHSTEKKDYNLLIEKAKEISNKKPSGKFCIVSGPILHGISSFASMKHQILWRCEARYLSGTYKVIIKNGKNKLVPYNPNQLFLKNTT